MIRPSKYPHTLSDAENSTIILSCSVPITFESISVFTPRTNLSLDSGDLKLVPWSERPLHVFGHRAIIPEPCLEYGLEQHPAHTCQALLSSLDFSLADKLGGLQLEWLFLASFCMQNAVFTPQSGVSKKWLSVQGCFVLLMPLIGRPLARRPSPPTLATQNAADPAYE